MTTTQQDPREAKLPRWAQDVLTDARRRVESAERLAEEARMATDPDASLAVINQWDEDRTIGLGEDPRVAFRLGDGPEDTVTCRLETRRGRRRLIVASSGAVLLIRPEVSNVVTVDLDERS